MSQTDQTGSTGLDRAWGWVEHLRAGGTTGWRDWRTTTAPNSGHGRVVPGAQQLELLRRVNAVARPAPGLAERILGASAPGRGRPDLELVGAAEESPFGARPVDPGDLGDHELLRVAAHLIAEDVAAAGVPTDREPAMPRPWRKRYRLVGDPLLSDPVRRHLIARGHPPRPKGDIIVVGADLGQMLSDAWTARCFGQGAMPWPDFVDTWRQRRRLPPRIDLPRLAATWAERRGADRVHIVLEPAALRGRVGVRRLPRPETRSADAAELARRVAAMLGLMVTPPVRGELMMGTFWPRLADAPGRPAGVPAELHGWLTTRATAMATELRRAGYPVHGDLEALVPSLVKEPSLPTTGGALELAVRTLLGAGAETATRDAEGVAR
ncbi:hypothetical protein [Nocardioides sp. InS609-2]|uniref:hypothetical protein n=1 Tax=Nocardioides sp. InS609-2 TaxID=2760705 RepID=UPI0020BE82D5|nr:hypothetical protein [Nocardioides sp. InS609-2]